MKTCKREGCCKPVVARLMCSTHYAQWRRANPGAEARRVALTLKTIEDCLPATLAQIRAETMMCDEAIKNALASLHEKGRAHIGDFEPPTTKGTRFQPIWVYGAGENKRITNAMRRKHRLKSERDAYHQRQMIKRAMAANSHGWASPLRIAA